MIGIGVVLAVLLLSTVTGYTLSLRSPGADRATMTSLQEIELQRMKAVVDADLPFLARVYAEDCTLVPPAGDRLARKDFLDAVADGSLDFRSYELVSCF
ncbi:nuclear transport factor 2 family protein [Kribbella sp. NBC_01510]|uniref:nuclear transport factor 2 family protein n=1 Tax=Kribbella sp. NBC_01510 TaxID=2903581 RepID=UPI00386A3C88